MALYQLGSQGDEVARIQQALRDRGLYTGAVDGAFGGGTLAAVRAFQAQARVSADGVVGPGTWKLLFNETIAAPAGARKPLNLRCLGLTGSFETGQGPPDCFGGLAGDFDGQGLSYGVCQWNLGQGTLQPLLLRLFTQSPEVVTGIFGTAEAAQLRAALSGERAGALAFARSIQDPVRKTIHEPWKGMFLALGRTPELQACQVAAAGGIFADAQKLCAEYGLRSERAVALMFDLKVQNGSISPAVKALILEDFKAIPGSLPAAEAEVARLKIVANRRAEAASAQWVESVRARKLCCALGGGVVNGVKYDLEAQFGIGLDAAAEFAPAAAA